MLDWTDNSNNETGFRVQRKDLRPNMGGFSSIALLNANQTNFTDLGLESGVPYEYRIRATNDDGNSSASNRITLTTSSVSGSGNGNGTGNSGDQESGDSSGTSHPGFQAGIVQADPNGGWKTISFSSPFPSVPVVVAGPATHNDAEPCTVRVRNITESGFEIRVQEWDYLDGVHQAEWVSYLAAVEGLQSLGGLDCVVGKTTANSSAGVVTFRNSFSAPPVVLSQVFSQNNTLGSEARSLVTRNESVNTSSFALSIQSHEGFRDPLAEENIGFIAIALGSGTLGQAPVHVGIETSTPKWRDLNGDGKIDPFTLAHGIPGANPVFLAAIQTKIGNDPSALRYGNIQSGSLDFTLEEDTFFPDTDHAPESIGYFIIGE